MDILIFSLRFIIFNLSLLGYIIFVQLKLGIPLKFSWIFTLSSIACIINFAGLCNILLYGVYTIFFIGLFLLIYYIVRRKISQAFGRKDLNILNILFIIVFGVIFSSLINTKYIHYDNFSHWGLIVKYLLITNDFPTTFSTIIDFKSYPLGTSSYLYYFCKIVGNTQGIMLLGQAMLLFASFYAIFGIIKDSKRLLLSGILALCCASMSFFNISIRINNLLVDFIMPILALAAIAAIYNFRHRFSKACIISLPIMALLVIVKNSGLFFALICYLFLTYVAVKQKRKMINLLISIVTIVSSLLTYVAWNIHTTIEFSGDLSKHSMNVANYSDVYTEKTPEVISQIIQHFYTATFSLDSLSTKGIVIFNIIAIITTFIARFLFKKKWSLLKVLLYLDFAIVLYYIGILAMFLFSMPTEEALILAGFERYASSIVIFFIGGLGMCTVCDTENSFYIQQGEKRDYKAFKNIRTKTIYEYTTIGLISLASIILLSEINGMNRFKTNYSKSLPAQVEALVGDNWEQTKEEKYLFFASDTDSQISNYYLQYVGKYFLFTSNVEATEHFDEKTFLEDLQEYDYLVILEHNTQIDKLMSKYVATGVQTGIYSIKDTFPQ